MCVNCANLPHGEFCSDACENDYYDTLAKRSHCDECGGPCLGHDDDDGWAPYDYEYEQDLLLEQQELTDLENMYGPVDDWDGNGDW